MFSAISNFFSRQITQLNRAHAEVSWEEALDSAIYKISQLKDLESDHGKEQLGKSTLRQLANLCGQKVLPDVDCW